MAKFNLPVNELPPAPSMELAAGRPRIRYSAEQLRQYRITSDSQVAKPEPAIYIRDSVIAMKGDLAVISGPAKGGKSAVCLNMLASALSPDDTDIDTLSIQVPHAGTKPVIYVDTEQGDYAVAGMLKRLCSILGLDRAPTNLHMLSLREEPKERAYDIITSYLEAEACPHLVIIDGIGDLVGSANDEVEGIRILREFMAQASRLKTTIVTVLHDSHANSAKPRGHLGSEAERKAGGLIAVAMENGVRYLVARKLRYGANFDPVPFMWCDISKRFISMEPSDIPARLQVDRAANREAEARLLAKQCFPYGTAEVRSKALVDLVRTTTKKGESIAYKRIEDMVEFGFVTARKDGSATYYSIAAALQPQPDPQMELSLP
ncbi:AAA family ATPase [Hymenobacter swuensis]|uniref:AAA family ATPase n=1 Tax=Hymenobacter swuensis TaxID=1446467 RepID=UPI0009DE5EED|nr:AAA family ATPase [Hymenobacter swuensis]